MKKAAYKTGGQAGQRVAFSLSASIGMMVAGAVIVTSLVAAGKLGEELIPTVASVLLFASTLVGAVVASMGRDPFWVPLAASVAMEYLLLIATNVVAYDGGLERIGVSTLAVVLGAGAAVVLKYIPIDGSGRKKYRRRFR